MTKRLLPHKNVRTRANAARAFREIARRIEEQEMMPEGSGVCRERDTLIDSGFLTLDGEEVMMDLIFDHMNALNGTRRKKSGFAYDPGTEWEARCLATLWMALEVESGDELPLNIHMDY